MLEGQPVQISISIVVTGQTTIILGGEERTKDNKLDNTNVPTVQPAQAQQASLKSPAFGVFERLFKLAILYLIG